MVAYGLRYAVAARAFRFAQFTPRRYIQHFSRDQFRKCTRGIFAVESKERSNEQAKL
jgi:hypothetical protein